MTPKMQYIRLGNSGLKVSKIILGCMSYGDPGFMPWFFGEEEAAKHIKFAWEHGITTFDTADVYSNGLSEVILGNAIKKLGLPRDELVIMTKTWAPVVKGYGVSMRAQGKTPRDFGIINQKGLSRKHIFDGVKASLRRLQMDYIDVLHCHRFDYETPIEETMQALHELVQSGLVRYIGMSSCWAYQFHAMQNYAITHNLTPFISMQNLYNLAYREEEREMFPTLKMFGVGATPWSPLSRGMLARPMPAASEDGSIRSKTDPEVNYSVPFVPTLLSRIEELAKKKNATMAQVSLAWVMAKPGVSAPIVGSTTVSRLEDLLGALDVTLTDEEMKDLEEPYLPVKVFGHM